VNPDFGQGSLLGGLIGGLFMFGGTWLVQRNAKRATTTDGAQKLIDQLQEEGAKKDQRIERLEVRVDALTDYVSALRHHIDTGGRPPPPPFPPDLIPGRHAP